MALVVADAVGCCKGSQAVTRAKSHRDDSRRSVQVFPSWQAARCTQLRARVEMAEGGQAGDQQ